MYDSLIGVAIRVSEEMEAAKKFGEFSRPPKLFVSLSHIIIDTIAITILATHKQPISTTTMSSSVVAKSDLLHLYRRILRGCQKYPSKNRDKIFESVREDFRENMNLDPTCEYTGELEEHGTLAVYCKVFGIESKAHFRFVFYCSLHGSSREGQATNTRCIQRPQPTAPIRQSRSGEFFGQSGTKSLPQTRQLRRQEDESSR